MVVLPHVSKSEPPRYGKRSLNDVIEDIGFGPGQIATLLLAGGIWIADGSELLILGSVTRAVSDEWNLNGFQRGTVVSIVFLGILLGNTSSGPLGDGLGRKLPILLSYLGIVVFSVLSASATGFLYLAAVRMLVGYAFGLGQPATTTLTSEVTPARWRYLAQGQSLALFCIGELYAACLIWLNDPTMKSLDWRWLCMAGAVPSIIGVVLAYLFLKESPAYLDENGYHAEAVATLESLKARNGREGVSCEFVTAVKDWQTPRSARDHIATVFAPSMIFTTVSMMFSCFVLNSCFYGSLYAFPQVLADVETKTSQSPAVLLMIGAMVAWPGFLVAPLLERFVPEKVLLLCYSGLCGLGLVMMVLGSNGEGIVYSILLQCGYLGVKTMLSVGFVAVYTATSTVFPAAARTTGVAACLAAGRIGGMLAPLLFEQSRDFFGSWQPFFLGLAGCYVLNFFSFFLAKLDSDDVIAIDEDEVKPLVKPLVCSSNP